MAGVGIHSFFLKRLHKTVAISYHRRRWHLWIWKEKSTTIVWTMSGIILMVRSFKFEYNCCIVKGHGTVYILFTVKDLYDNVSLCPLYVCTWHRDTLCRVCDFHEFAINKFFWIFHVKDAVGFEVKVIICCPCQSRKKKIGKIQHMLYCRMWRSNL